MSIERQIEMAKARITEWVNTKAEILKNNLDTEVWRLRGQEQLKIRFPEAPGRIDITSPEE